MKLLDELSEAEITEISNLVSAFETDWARAPNRASKNELESVFALSNDQAAHYALIRVAATRVIVRAENAKGTIFCNYPEGHTSIPFYPTKEFLIQDFSGESSDVKAVEFSLDEWIERYLTEMPKDHLLVELLPQPTKCALLIDPDLLRGIISKMREELSGRN